MRSVLPSPPCLLGLALLLCTCAGPARSIPREDPPASWDEPPRGPEMAHEDVLSRPGGKAQAERQQAAISVEPMPQVPAQREPLAQGAKMKRVPYAGPRGVIRRPDLLALLDQQPAAFLRSVDTMPHFQSGRFRGWAINSFYPDDPRFEGIDLMKGDVVTRVNGLPIEMPEQFMLVWQGMRKAKELRVELLRNGQPHVSRWSIVD